MFRLRCNKFILMSKGLRTTARMQTMAICCRFGFIQSKVFMEFRVFDNTRRKKRYDDSFKTQQTSRNSFFKNNNTFGFSTFRYDLLYLMFPSFRFFNLKNLWDFVVKLTNENLTYGSTKPFRQMECTSELIQVLCDQNLDLSSYYSLK